MARNFIFIVNPNAGRRVSDRIVRAITEQFLPTDQHRIVVWKDKDDFGEIESLLKSGEFTDAIAVGGDGTVNRVAQAILGTKVVLGIVPVGSGNGLARSLGLSVKLETALQQINEGSTRLIDTGYVNDRLFLCTSGVGFDAHIGKLFASSTTRGLSTYVKITIRELWRYRAKPYSITLNGTEHKKKAFLVTVANAGQYGNDFYIAPGARLTDGLFHVVVLKPFNPLEVFGLFLKILRKRAETSSCIETYTAERVTITRESDDTIHFDGEPAEEEKVLNYRNSRTSLRVIVGNETLV